MFQLLLIRIVNILLNIIHSILIPILIFILLIPKIILNHHNTLPLIMPSRLGLLPNNINLALAPNKERFGEDSINEHDIALDGEKPRVIRLVEVLEGLEAFYFLLEFLF
jgi:hypothetical protein